MTQSDGKGKSLLFLQPSEVGFLKHLKEARVPLVEFEFPAKRIFSIQSQLEKLIAQNYYLNKVPCSHIFRVHGHGRLTFGILVGQRCLPFLSTSVRLSQSEVYL